MRVAPSVQALSCSAGPWRRLRQGLVGSSVAVGAAWCGARLGLGDMAAWLGALAPGLMAALAAGRGSAASGDRLAWDGTAWELQRKGRDPQTGQASLMVDLGGWMLVRFTPGPRWLPLARRDVVDWHALRVALYAEPPRQPGA